ERQFTGFLAILSVFTLISVTTDTVKFLVEDFGLPYWVKWLWLVVPTALAIFALVLIVFGKSRDHSR
ncbi:MAG TPA: hypothetical protein VE844_16855, partial [Gammaproteobacteria bacterium]|nr:hypothetical protein [Gammaproteobacteria bacterium]